MIKIQQNSSSFHIPAKPLDSFPSQFTDASSSPSSGFKNTGVSTKLAKKKRGRLCKYIYDNNSLHSSDKSVKILLKLKEL